MTHPSKSVSKTSKVPRNPGARLFVHPTRQLQADQCEVHRNWPYTEGG